VVDGVLYAVGGGRAGEALNVVEAYDPGTNTWTTGLSSMPTPRREFAIGVVNGILYAVGGSDGSSVLSSMDAYNPATDSWETMAPMPTARRHLAVGVVDGILYAVGGSRASNIFDVVEAYDPVTNTWRTLTSMPTARRDLAMGVVNGRLYAVGGYNGESVLHANEEGMPVYAPTCTPTAILSTQGKPVLAPVPATRGTKVCMFYTKAPTSSEMEIYNSNGEKLGKVSTVDLNNHCWDTKNAAPGIYFVKIVVVYADGKKETIWRKAVVIP
jgi:hypothetical protein